MIERIISGGQTGADRAALNVAIQLGIPHGGWCPRGRRAEDGRIPDHYQLQETRDDGYLVRTKRNVESSDGTIIFVDRMTAGSARTRDYCRQIRKPFVIIANTTSRGEYGRARLIAWLHLAQPRILNVAGSRESRAPGIASAVHSLLYHVLQVIQP